MRLGMLIFTVLVAVSSTARAQAPSTTTAYELQSDCRAAEAILEGRSTKNYEDGYSCISYIAGFREGTDMLKIMGAVDKPLYCIPDAATTGQLLQVFQKWAAEHPQQLHLHRSIALSIAWGVAFPCPSA